MIVIVETGNPIPKGVDPASDDVYLLEVINQWDWITDSVAFRDDIPFSISKMTSGDSQRYESEELKSVPTIVQEELYSRGYTSVRGDGDT